MDRESGEPILGRNQVPSEYRLPNFTEVRTEGKILGDVFLVRCGR